MIMVLEPGMCMLIYFMFIGIYMGMNNYAHRKYTHITMYMERYVYYTYIHTYISIKCMHMHTNIGIYHHLTL